MGSSFERRRHDVTANGRK